MYIETNESLQKLCDELEQATVIFFDTEFMREKTFYPKLCLLQIGFNGMNYAVDPLVINVQPLLEQLVSRETLLVFHSGRQDLEILFNATGKLPKNILDTQIAATVCGFGEQVSYAELVNRLTGNVIDKSQRFTDWSIRPLSSHQIDYALKDVVYLPEVFEKLSNEINQKERKKWLLEDEKALLEITSYQEDPDNAWTKVKSKNKRYADVTVLKELAKWRDEQARKLDKPRRRIVSDDILTEFAVQKPKTPESLDKLRIIGNVSRETMERMREIVVEADLLPKEAHKKVRGGGRDRFDEEIADLLKILLKYNSAKLGVIAKLVATNIEIADFIRGEEVQFMHGWRYDAFGADAEKLLRGEVSFRVNGDKFEIVRT